MDHTQARWQAALYVELVAGKQSGLASKKEHGMNTQPESQAGNDEFYMLPDAHIPRALAEELLKLWQDGYAVGYAKCEQEKKQSGLAPHSNWRSADR